MKGATQTKTLSFRLEGRQEIESDEAIENRVRTLKGVTDARVNNGRVTVEVAADVALETLKRDLTNLGLCFKSLGRDDAAHSLCCHLALCCLPMLLLGFVGGSAYLSWFTSWPFLVFVGLLITGLLIRKWDGARTSGCNGDACR